MPAPETLRLICDLVAFDTTSRESNLALIDYVRAYLARFGVESLLAPNPEGTKANLYATLGPGDRPGIMLSGHTDVVPVDGQAWSSEPFKVAERDGRLYGRGTCDMKGFLAIALAFVPKFLERGLAIPIHLAFSFDEEVGCLGVRHLIERMKDMPVKPYMCIVGEPTSMQVVTGHKGKRTYVGRVSGHEAHSSLAPEGVNAVEYAAQVIAHMKGIARRLAKEGPFDDLFDVAFSTLHTGTISGGTALNIVPRACEFMFEIRHLPRHDPEPVVAEIRAFADTLIPEMRAISPAAGIEIVETNAAPGLDMDPGADVVAFVKALAGRNDHAKVAFATEAGLFHDRVGIPTVICGPGAIAQAHKPDEFIALEQVDKGEAFMGRLLEKVAAS